MVHVYNLSSSIKHTHVHIRSYMKSSRIKDAFKKVFPVLSKRLGKNPQTRINFHTYELDKFPANNAANLILKIPYCDLLLLCTFILLSILKAWHVCLAGTLPYGRQITNETLPIMRLQYRYRMASQLYCVDKMNIYSMKCLILNYWLYWYRVIDYIYYILNYL